MDTKRKVNVWWKYVVLLMLILAFRPTTYFIRQALRGDPIDINYFWTELSPFGLLKQGLYNGNGGADWKIGRPQVSIWNAEQLRSEPELRKFALELVNRDRTLNKLKPLTADSLLSLAAQFHAQDMLERQYFNHISLDGKNPRDRYIQVGGNRRVAVGENIIKDSVQGLGFTYGKVEDFQRGWMYSNSHRQNLLRREYKKFGYGIAVGKNGQIYAVQMFSD
ncbi:CAP domain-containing protein [Nostoc sp. FACHB-87]|uniref:CAP domain-containing protein n=1 Tax=Nostocaceae TaxID=1162 RepID=UPI001686BFA3|nr:MULTISPECIES: CAP domain-containing protein [Nostocaceae]MBD2452519.1 CAP domain-containing protein [Nostoc sp. FACHB-87]MBD2473450.1 CAP domain-containing protein [Anabaena sp. FACHB-83]